MTERGDVMATIVCDPLMERITDALLDMRSKAIAAREARALEPLTVWTVRRFVPEPFERGGVRPLPNATGDRDTPWPQQWTRFADLVRQARTWNGTGIRGAVTWCTARQRQSTLRRALGRAA